jgi:hypothetical protein
MPVLSPLHQVSCPAGNVEEGDALIVRRQQTWRWNIALQKQQHLLKIILHLGLQKQSHIGGEVNCELTAQEAVGIFPALGCNMQ